MDLNEKQRKEIGQCLTDLMHINGQSDMDIARAAHMPVDSVQQILGGSADYATYGYRKVAEACGYSLEKLAKSGEQLVAEARQAKEGIANTPQKPLPDTPHESKKEPHAQKPLKSPKTPANKPASKRKEPQPGPSHEREEQLLREKELLNQHKKTAGSVLARLKDIHGFSVNDLVEKTAMKKPTVEGILAGNKGFSQDAYQKVSSVLGEHSFEELAQGGERIIADAQKIALEKEVQTHNESQRAIDAGELSEMHSKVTGRLFSRVSHISGIPLNQLASSANLTYKTVTGILYGNDQYAREKVETIAQELGLGLSWRDKGGRSWVEKVTLPGDTPQRESVR
jgi:predicted transcriptional regulator